MTAEAHHYDQLHRLIDRLAPNQAEAVRAVVLELVTNTEHAADEAEDLGAGETVSFGLDGTSYEIDLSSDDAARLRHALAEFVANARPATEHERARRQFSFAGSMTAEPDFATRSEEILAEVTRRNTA